MLADVTLLENAFHDENLQGGAVLTLGVSRKFAQRGRVGGKKRGRTREVEDIV
jgi:hypothetical protein